MVEGGIWLIIWLQRQRLLQCSVALQFKTFWVYFPNLYEVFLLFLFPSPNCLTFFKDSISHSEKVGILSWCSTPLLHRAIIRSTEIRGCILGCHILDCHQRVTSILSGYFKLGLRVTILIRVKTPCTTADYQLQTISWRLLVPEHIGKVTVTLVAGDGQRASRPQNDFFRPLSNVGSNPNTCINKRQQERVRSRSIDDGQRDPLPYSSPAWPGLEPCCRWICCLSPGKRASTTASMAPQLSQDSMFLLTVRQELRETHAPPLALIRLSGLGREERRDCPANTFFGEPVKAKLNLHVAPRSALAFPQVSVLRCWHKCGISRRPVYCWLNAELSFHDWEGLGVGDQTGT